MAAHTEIELKWALTGAAHAALATRLRETLGEASELAQDNRFFDTADLRLRRELMNLRLRRENGRLLMTCKRRLADRAGDGGAHRHAEFELWLEPALWDDLVDPDLAARLPLPDDVRTVIAGAPLRALGGFANHRLEHRHGDDLLCLDRTDFGARVDHELEIETPAPAESARAWGERLRGWGIAYARQRHTKFARFVELSRGRDG